MYKRGYLFQRKKWRYFRFISCIELKIATQKMCRFKNRHINENRLWVEHRKSMILSPHISWSKSGASSLMKILISSIRHSWRIARRSGQMQRRGFRNIDFAWYCDTLELNQAEDYRQFVCRWNSRNMWFFVLLFLIPYNQDMYVWAAVRRRLARTSEYETVTFRCASGCERKRGLSRVSYWASPWLNHLVKENTANEADTTSWRRKAVDCAGFFVLRNGLDRCKNGVYITQSESSCLKDSDLTPSDINTAHRRRTSSPQWIGCHR